MSQILKVKDIQEKISIMDAPRADKIIINENGNNILCYRDGSSVVPECINCTNPHCMQFSNLDIESGEFNEMSCDRNKKVCPVDAISKGKECITINKTKCIGCGLCVNTCPFGAIHMNNGKATLNKAPKSILRQMNCTTENINKQKRFIKEYIGVRKVGCIQNVSSKLMENVYMEIAKLSQYEQNLLARNLLISLGNQVALSRQGDVYTRMDGFFNSSKQYGVVEIETGLDMLDVSRAILDDVAVLQTRYAINKSNNHPLAICLSLPNRRTDYWQVVKDIRDVTGIQINTITFGALLIALWHLEEIDDFDSFYIDIDNSSIRRAMEDVIEKKINISFGNLSVLETGK